MKRAAYAAVAILLASIVGLAGCGSDGATEDPADSTTLGVEAAPAQASSGDAIVGQRLFTKNCSACHGQAGEGIKGLGKALTTSEFVAGKNDQALVDFIKVGRDPKDPLNTTGIRMYPKGGNPDLTDEDLFDIVAHIRNINEVGSR